jgi:hypothetical protein
MSVTVQSASGPALGTGVATWLATPTSANLAAALNSNAQAVGYVLAQTGVVSSHTGDTNESVLATIAIPAGIIGANGQVVLETAWSATSSANTKTVRQYFGAAGAGTGGTLIATMNPTAALGVSHDTRQFANANSASSQVFFLSTGGGAAGGWGQVNATGLTAAINTASAAEFTLTGQLSNTGETVTLIAYRVIVYPKA